MKKKCMAIIWIFCSLFFLLVFTLCLFLLYLTLADFRPRAAEALTITGPAIEKKVTSRELSFLTWNIGYGGLGKEMDFFYEGGTMVRPGKKSFTRYLAGIKTFIDKQDSIDFIFLQEVDTRSKRSYYEDETGYFSEGLNDYYKIFARNYGSRFVPQPFLEPMGRVESGIMTLCRYKPAEAVRYGFDVNFAWPKSLFFPKRCFMVLRYRLENDKELVILTLHNSTFDTEGRLRKKELLTLQEFMLKEFRSGKYVIAGGDWNNNPPGFQTEEVITGDPSKYVEPRIDFPLLHGWHFAYDPSSPTNRYVDMPYEKGRTNTTIIDFFVVSPNITVESVKTIPTGFENSDHQPVALKVKI